MFNLSKEDDVRQYVVRRQFTNKKGKEVSKAPKIQRLVTPLKLQRKRRRLALKKQAREKSLKAEAAYQKLYQQRLKEAKQRRASEISKRRSRNSKKQE
mmetsp:Transcript_6326/g.7663  ORF Transcript_6326/g.7663 Transcript_6326/m.7663 type:complete len:98 (+) Transcript_6326:190-483(+)